jgi:hypothetical protein
LDKFHIDKNIVFFVDSPPKNLGDWNLVTKGPFDHPKALCFCGCDMGAKLDEEFGIFEYNRLRLRVRVSIL